MFHPRADVHVLYRVQSTPAISPAEKQPFTPFYLEQVVFTR